MSARSALHDLLGGALPIDVDLIKYSREIDSPLKSTVMIRVDEVAPSTAASGLRDYQFALVLIAAKTAAGAGDDELDALLEDVLFALDQVGEAVAGVTWSSAKRATYNENNPAYEVAVSVTVEKES
jgi:chitinase